jgi:hypothetical protein
MGTLGLGAYVALTGEISGEELPAILVAISVFVSLSFLLWIVGRMAGDSEVE